MSRYFFYALLILCSFISCKDEEPFSKKREALSFTISNTAYKTYSNNAPAVNFHTLELTAEDGETLTLYGEETVNNTSFTQPQTRGDIIGNETQFPNKIMIGIDSYDHTHTPVGSMFNFIDKKEATKQISTTTPSIYTLANTYYYPQNKKLKCYAYTPLKDSLQLNYGADITLSCTQSPDVTRQYDVLGATIDQATETKTINLPFKHLTTAIQFQITSEEQKNTIQEATIEIQNVYTKGSYSFKTNQWSVDKTTPSTTSGGSTQPTYKQTLKYHYLSEEALKNRSTPDNLSSLNDVFFIIPQTLETNAKLVLNITYANNPSQSKTFTADLSGKVYTPGKLIIYRLQQNTIVSNIVTTIPAAGKTESVQIISKDPTNKTPLPWTATFSEDDGKTFTTTPPTWITNFPTSGNGGTETFHDVIFKENAGSTLPKERNKEDSLLKKKSSIGSDAEPYNLSGNSITDITETANCYVINNPGVYIFPAVYGNGIKNNSFNTNAYQSTQTKTDFILNKFINHLGNEITSPYIIDNSITPTKAELVWQDKKNVISDVQWVPATFNNKGGIKFKVTSENIAQCNAVIALKDANNNVVWSWHIWVTHKNPTTDKQNFSYTKSSSKRENGRTITTDEVYYNKKFLPYLLGYISSYKYIFTERSVKVKIKNSKQEKIITITQHPEEFMVRSGATYYQWGRKDPMPPSLGTPILPKYQQSYFKNIGAISPETTLSQNFYSTYTINDYISTEKILWNNNSDTIPRNSPQTKKIDIKTKKEDWIKEGITNPFNFLIIDQTLSPPLSSSSKYDKSLPWGNYEPIYYNLWSINTTIHNTILDNLTSDQKQTTPQKTIYDPCPRGFVVPYCGEFFIISSAGVRNQRDLYNYNEFSMPFPIDQSDFVGLRSSYLNGKVYLSSDFFSWTSAVYTNNPNTREKPNPYSNKKYLGGAKYTKMDFSNATPIFPMEDANSPTTTNTTLNKPINKPQKLFK